MVGYELTRKLKSCAVAELERIQQEGIRTEAGYVNDLTSFPVCMDVQHMVLDALWGRV